MFLLYHSPVALKKFNVFRFLSVFVSGQFDGQKVLGRIDKRLRSKPRYIKPGKDQSGKSIDAVKQKTPDKLLFTNRCSLNHELLCFHPQLATTTLNFLKL